MTDTVGSSLGYVETAGAIVSPSGFSGPPYCYFLGPVLGVFMLVAIIPNMLISFFSEVWQSDSKADHITEGPWYVLPQDLVCVENISFGVSLSSSESLSLSLGLCGGHSTFPLRSVIRLVSVRS